MVNSQPVDRFNALLPFYRALICGTCDHLRNEGLMSYLSYLVSEIKLAQDGTYNLQHWGDETENGRHYLEILSAHSYICDVTSCCLASLLANLTLVLKSVLGMTLL